MSDMLCGEGRKRIKKEEEEEKKTRNEKKEMNAHIMRAAVY